MSTLLVKDIHPVYPDRVGPLGWAVVRDGRFEAFGTGAVSPRNFDAIMDGAGAMMMPGLIDTHVHFREPGMTVKGDIASESAAALRGGVTMVFDMPNTRPMTTTRRAFYDKVELFRDKCLTDFRIFLGAAPGIMKELPGLDRRYLAGVKLFWGSTTGSGSMPGAEELDELFSYCARENIIIMVHAEDDSIIARNFTMAAERHHGQTRIPIREHRSIRSTEACLSASRQAVDLARRHGTRLHLAHITTLEELALLEPGDLRDKLITAETTPLYTSAILSDPANFTYRLKVNPAVKGEEEAVGLQKALRNDLIDTLGTDHAPHLLADKKRCLARAASGAPWVQFALPLLLETFTPELIARKMAQAPARLFGLEGRGELRPGFRADFSLVTPCAPYRVNDSDAISSCGWTPLKGVKLHHRITATMHFRGTED